MANPVTEGYRGARALRRQLRLDGRQRVDPFELAHQLGIVVVRRPLVERRIAGVYLHRPADGRSFVLVNSSDLLVRQRFTAAHELGHWRFDRESVVVDDDFEGGYTAEERRANAFAAELLLPEAAIGSWKPQRPWGESVDDIASLAVTYGLSYDATLWRLRNCGIAMDDEQLRTRRGEIASEYRTQLATRGEEATILPAEFISLTDAALERHLISRKRYEELRGQASAMRF